MTYHVSGFVEKNTDLLDKDLSCVMFQSDHPLLRTLFPEGELLTTVPNDQNPATGESISKH